MKATKKTSVQKAMDEGKMTFSFPNEEKNEKANKKFFKNLRFKIVETWKKL